MTDNIQKEIEDKVIDCINSGVAGRLIIFKPENSDKDLAIEKRSNYKKKTIFLNIYEGKFLNSQALEKEISQLAVKKDISKEKDFYLLFVLSLLALDFY